ncbi:MAG TPA: hypothetical protein VGI24_07245 [Solirubrobacteraceae bacterium]
MTAGLTSQAAQLPDELKHLPEKRDLLEIQLKAEFARQDIALKKTYAEQEIALRETYAKGLLLILTALLVVVNTIFWFYAEKGQRWKIPSEVIQVWLGATVVQVVGVVTVVTKYLFPNRDGQPDPPVPPTAPTLSA